MNETAEQLTSFVLVSEVYKVILVVVLIYFAIKFKDWVMGAIIILGTVDIWLQLNGHYELAILISNPVATLLAYKLVTGGKHRLEVKHPADPPPAILPDVLTHDKIDNEDISTKGGKV